MSAKPTRRELIVELASRPCGVSSADIRTLLGVPDEAIPVNMQALEYQGRVIRAKADGFRLRWFVSTEHRAAYLEAMKDERAAVLEAQAEAKRVRERARDAAKAARRRALKQAKPAKPAKALQKKAGPVALTTYTAGSSKVAPKIHSGPVDYSRAKYIIDDKPRAVAAWQMQPSQPPVGFAAAGIGRYL